MSNKRNHQNPDSDLLFFDGDVEVRSLPNDGGKVIFGYWAKYGVRSNELRTRKGVRFVEEILPGAFDKTDFSDLESRFNHENILAAPPTLKVGLDSVGGWYEIPVDPSDPDHMSALRKIERKDAKGSSFEFDPPGPNDQVVSDEAGIKLRRIHHIPKVWEVGPVINPAYPRTTPFVRSLDLQVEEDLQAQQEFQKRKTEAQKFLEAALS